jgi:hypothetical protein
LQACLRPLGESSHASCIQDVGPPNGQGARMNRFILAFCMTAALVSPAHTATRWSFTPSITVDALCLAGVLADDPFYVRYYEKQHEDLSRRLTPRARDAFKRITAQSKAEGDIATAWLTLLFSASDAKTLPQLIAAAERPADLEKKLRASAYWEDAAWERFERLRPDILVVLRWYRDIDFPAYWRADAEAPIEAAIADLQPELQKADVIPLVERVLGRKLDSNEIQVVTARYCRPHGIRILGNRFITDPTYPKDRMLAVVGGTSVHELLHPPFDPKDPRILRAIAVARDDPFVQSRFKGHNPAFGYNTIEGLFDEDSTQALDQVINEKIGFAFHGGDPAQRWAKSDEGLHVLAAAIYTLMKQEAFLESGQDYSSFIDRMVREGKLAPGKVEALVPEPVRAVGAGAR